MENWDLQLDWICIYIISGMPLTLMHTLQPGRSTGLIRQNNLENSDEKGR